MTQVLLSIGSNQNAPQEQIRRALSRLEERHPDMRTSSLYETQPVGGIPQASYLNAGISLHTEMTPEDLLSELLRIEREAGRNRGEEQRNGPRNLDLDIILYGDLIVENNDLTLPHPRFRQRRFVLVPLNEIAADFIDPVTSKSLAGLLAICPDQSWVKSFTEEAMAS